MIRGLTIISGARLSRIWGLEGPPRAYKRLHAREQSAITFSAFSPEKRVFSATKVVFIAFSINFGHILTYSPNSTNIEILKNRSEWRVRPLWGKIGLFEKHAKNDNADFPRACKRLHVRGGPSSPRIRDKRAPEIIFNPPTFQGHTS